MVTIKDGINFQAKIIKSNRFSDLVEVTGCDLGDRTATFDLTEEAEDVLTKASDPLEVDKVILALYESKKGRRS